jgi:hypothetical protein
MDIVSHFDNGVLNVTIISTDYNVDPIVAHLNGISDTIDVLSRFMTFCSNIFANRLKSFSHYAGALSRFNTAVNSLIEMIPDEIDIPGTNLYIEGGVSDHFHVEKDEYIQIPLDLSLQNREFPFYRPNNVTFGDFAPNDYQI